MVVVVAVERGLGCGGACKWRRRGWVGPTSCLVSWPLCLFAYRLHVPPPVPVRLQLPAEAQAELLNTQAARCMDCGTPYCLNKTTGGCSRGRGQGRG